MVETGPLFTLECRAVEETDLRVEELLGSKKEHCVGVMAVDIYKNRGKKGTKEGSHPWFLSFRRMAEGGSRRRLL